VLLSENDVPLITVIVYIPSTQDIPPEVNPCVSAMNTCCPEDIATVVSVETTAGLAAEIEYTGCGACIPGMVRATEPDVKAAQAEPSTPLSEKCVASMTLISKNREVNCAGPETPMNATVRPFGKFTGYAVVTTGGLAVDTLETGTT